MATPEHCIQNDIMLDLGGRRDVRIWRNNVGQAWTGRMVEHRGGRVVLEDARPLHAGLAKGSADLIGIQRLRVLPAHVGLDIGVFLSIECKAPGARPTQDQKNWLQMVSLFGGAGGIAYSVEDARRLIL